MLFQDKKRFNLKNYGLFFLNFTQFSVVLVDNIFKLIIAFFLIDLEGPESAARILSLVGAVYVIPFLLLSSIGGSLADRYSKRTITICIKCMGGLILFASLYIFHIQSVFGAYLLLFLLATQSAIFGPSKYGMIPELVPQNQVAKANGYITSFTYLAIILGTFFGSYLSTLFNRDYIDVLLVTLIFSALGITASFLIPKKEVVRYNAPFSMSVFKETMEAILSYPKKAHLGVAMFASAFFLMIGGFTQMAIIPFAITILKKTEIIGGYLFLVTALGIALGSYLVGKLTKNRPQLLFPVSGGIVLGLMMIALGGFTKELSHTIAYLVILGLAGGFYIVPLEAFIQMTAEANQRGRILGANNFLAFVGVLCASGLLYFMNHLFGLNAGQCFLLLGIVTLIFASFLLLKFSDHLFAFWFSMKGVHKKARVILPEQTNLLIVPSLDYKTLNRFTINKERVLIVGQKNFLPFMSAYLSCPKNKSLHAFIQEQIDSHSLVLIQKGLAGFNRKEIKGRIETYDELL